jgi:hypothetical protein
MPEQFSRFVVFRLLNGEPERNLEGTDIYFCMLFFLGKKAMGLDFQ